MSSSSSALPLRPNPPALAAAFDHLSAFTRCDRCNADLSSSGVVVVQITADCDHLFCLDCDASSLAECPVCRLPTLPRKHHVHLSQVGAMFELVAGLKTELVKLGLMEEKNTVDAADRETATTTTMTSEVETLPDGVATTTAPPATVSIPPVTASSRAAKTPRIKRKLSGVGGQRPRVAATNDSLSPTMDPIERSPSENAAEKEVDAGKDAETGRRKVGSKSPAKETTLPSPPERRTPSRRRTTSTTTPPSPVDDGEGAASTITTSFVASPAPSPSPTTRQRLVSLRKKQRIVKAKKKEVNSNGETPLHVAARRGQEDKIKELISAGAALNTKDFAGLSPLFDACGRGFERVVEMLLVAGAHPNTPCGVDNETPLHEAVFHGHLKIMEHLLFHGANPRLENACGKTPLDLARHEPIKTVLTSHMQRLLSASTYDSNRDRGPIYIGSQLLRKDSPVYGHPSRTATMTTTSATKLTPVESFSNTLFHLSKSSSMKLVLLSTGIVDDDSSSIAAFVDAFDGVRSVDAFDVELVTHVVCRCDEEGNVGRTSKYLQGVVGGKKVVSIEWIVASLRRRRLEPEELFLVRGSTKNENCEGAKRSLLSHFYNFPPLFAGCHFYLQGRFRNPPEHALSHLIELSGGMILSRKPSFFDGPLSVPFHAQRCRFLKNACYYVIEDDESDVVDGDVGNYKGDEDNAGEEEERGREGGEGKRKESLPSSLSSKPRISRQSPRVAFGGKTWLLDCFDRFEIIDADAFATDTPADGGRLETSGNDVDVEDPLETLRRRQAARASRSKGSGTEYLMAL